MNEFNKPNRRFNSGVDVIKRCLSANGVDIRTLDNDLWKKGSLTQNRARGEMFELMAETLIHNVFGQKAFIKQKTYVTPHGKRVIDLYEAESRVAIEVKSGHVRLSRHIKKQIDLDFYIMKNEAEVENIVWMCFRGATKSVINILKSKGIQYCDIEYDKIDDSNESNTEKTIIRV